MRGMIGRKDVLTHPLVVIKGFGLKVFLKTLISPRGRTFLEVISEGIPRPVSETQIRVAEFFDKLVSYELRTSHIYARMAHHFEKRDDAKAFFLTLSLQEEGHAEILRITKVEVARRNLWSSVRPTEPEVLDSIDKELSGLEWEISRNNISLKQSLKSVEQLESSEINLVFDFILNSVQAPFLKKSHRLIPALSEHYAYLNKMLPALLAKENHE